MGCVESKDKKEKQEGTRRGTTAEQAQGPGVNQRAPPQPQPQPPPVVAAAAAVAPTQPILNAVAKAPPCNVDAPDTGVAEAAGAKRETSVATKVKAVTKEKEPKEQEGEEDKKQSSTESHTPPSRAVVPLVQNTETLLDSCLAGKGHSVKAVIIAATQPATQSALECTADINALQDTVEDCGGVATVLRDDLPTGIRPTKSRILGAIRNVVSSAFPGDTVLVVLVGYTTFAQGMGCFIPSGYDNSAYPQVVSGEELKDAIQGAAPECATVLVVDTPCPPLYPLLPVSTSEKFVSTLQRGVVAEVRCTHPALDSEAPPQCGSLTTAVGSLLLAPRISHTATGTNTLLALPHLQSVLASRSPRSTQVTVGYLCVQPAEAFTIEYSPQRSATPSDACSWVSLSPVTPVRRI